MSPPSITIAIPFRDEEAHLAAAIRSVLHQTSGDFELLLVDDGSTDGSLDVARSFDDRRIEIVHDRRARGLPARLNEIVRRARGELVARMDADDVIHPTRLERQIALLRADPSIDVVGTWAGLVDDAEVPFGVVESASLPPSQRTALTRGVMAHATIVARRRWLEAHPYDETLTRAEDRDLWVRSVGSTRFAIVPEPLYVVRIATREGRFLADYVEAQRQNRRIALRHGPATVGWAETARFCAAAHAKTFVMRAAHAAGMAPRLVRRRGRPPTARELVLLREALASSAQRP